MFFHVKRLIGELLYKIGLMIYKGLVRKSILRPKECQKSGTIYYLDSMKNALDLNSMEVLRIRTEIGEEIEKEGS